MAESDRTPTVVALLPNELNGLFLARGLVMVLGLRCLDVITGETINDFKNQRDLHRHADRIDTTQHGVSAAGGE
jgi:hypothetical protein